MRTALLATLAIAAVAAQANLSIDDFASGTYSRSLTSGSLTEFQTGSMIGGARYATTAVQSNSFGLAIQTDIQGSAYSLSSQPAVDGFGELGYGFTSSSTGPVAQDLDANLTVGGLNALRVNFLSSDAPGTLTVSVRSSSSGADFVSASTSFPGNSVNVPFTREIAYSQFVGVDFSDIDQMVFRFDTGPSGDVSLASIEAVPEPATIAVLAGIAAAAVRRKQKA